MSLTDPKGAISVNYTFPNYLTDTFKYHVFAPSDGNISVRTNLPLFSTVLPSNSRLFLSCRPFVVITIFLTDLVCEVTSVSCWKCCYNNERPTGQKQPTVRWKYGRK